MINPLVDLVLLWLLFIPAMALLWYSHTVCEVSGKWRYSLLLFVAHLIAAVIGFILSADSNNEVFELSFVAWLSYWICTSLWLFCQVSYHLMEYAFDNKWYEWAERLAEKRHGRKR